MPMRSLSSPRRWLDLTDRLPNGWLIGLVAGALVLSTAIVAGSGTEESVGRHLFYVPIVLAGLRFGSATGIGVGVLAMLLAGPLTGSADPAIWVGRGASFAFIGLLVGAMAGAREHSVGLEVDISEREHALAAQRVALVQVISHELRTPLTVLRGSIETLAQRQSLVAAEGRVLVQAMERSVLRLQDMVDVALAAADELEVDTSDQAPVDVKATVEHAAASLTRRLRRRLDVNIPSGTSLITVESQLWLALRCLLDNADKFSPRDGMVRVRYREVNHLAVISVEDQGPGFPDGFEEVAFEPFVQADPTERRSHPGLGMGLYTARRLARRLGGDVVLNSRGPERGGRAEVWLPQRRETDAADLPRAVPPTAVVGSGT